MDWEFVYLGRGFDESGEDSVIYDNNLNYRLAGEHIEQHMAGGILDSCLLSGRGGGMRSPMGGELDVKV